MAAALYNAGTLTLSHTTVSGNSAPGACGICNRGGGAGPFGTMALIDSTVSGNSATSSNYKGGGIRNDGTMTLINSTVSGNSASDVGGLYNATGMVTLSNSMVADSLQGGLRRALW